MRHRPHEGKVFAARHAVVGHNRYAVGVGVVRETDIGAHAFHFRHQFDHVFIERFGIVREMSVQLFVDARDAATQHFEYSWRDDVARAVATVQHNVKVFAAYQFDIDQLENRFDVARVGFVIDSLLADIFPTDSAKIFAVIKPNHFCALRFVQIQSAGLKKFQRVPFNRVMRSRDANRAIGVVKRHRELQCRRRHDVQIDDVAAACEQRAFDDVMQRLPCRSRIARN